MGAYPPAVHHWLRELARQSPDRQAAQRNLKLIFDSILNQVHPREKRGTKPRDVYDDTVEVLKPRLDKVEAYSGLLKLLRPSDKIHLGVDCRMTITETKRVVTFRPGGKVHTDEEGWITITESMLRNLQKWHQVNFRRDIVMKVMDRIMDREEAAPWRTAKRPDVLDIPRLAEHVREAASLYLLARGEPLPPWLSKRTWKHSSVGRDAFFTQLKATAKKRDAERIRSYIPGMMSAV